MDIQIVAHNILFNLAMTSIPTEKVSSGRTPSHAQWMLLRILHGDVEKEKAHRWLGYAQAILIEAEVFTLEKIKQFNKE